MRRAIALSFLILLLAAALPAQIPAKDRIVVLISIDGLPGWAFEDPRLPAPTLQRLAREGVLARAMKVSNPSVTWPNHTTLVTGVPPAQHGVLYNGLLVRQGPKSPPKVEPWRDKKELVRVTTVYDLAHQAGLTTAQVDWVAILNAPTITWEFAERPNVKGAIEREMIAAGMVTEEDVQEFAKAGITWRDVIWTKAAAHIIEKHKPNLLLFHLLNLDSTHHRYGPKTLASLTGIAYADSRVREILDTLERARLLDRATLVIVSDHGFKVAPRNVRPNALLRQRGLLRAEGSKVECDAYVVPEGGTAMVYVTNADNRARLAPQLKELFAGLEGVARVIEPAEYASLGLPDPRQNDQMADLVLAAKEGYGFSGAYEGEPVGDVPPGGSLGMHGFLSSDPAMNALFLAWGYGIRPGARLDIIENTDVAPTLAALLGLKMNGVKGKPLPILK